VSPSAAGVSRPAIGQDWANQRAVGGRIRLAVSRSENVRCEASRNWWCAIRQG
jgi:hypothetical protein